MHHCHDWQDDACGQCQQSSFISLQTVAFSQFNSDLGHPPQANLALNQFHGKDRMMRQQFFYLHLLEPESQGSGSMESRGPVTLLRKHKYSNN